MDLTILYNVDINKHIEGEQIHMKDRNPSVLLIGIWVIFDIQQVFMNSIYDTVRS